MHGADQDVSDADAPTIVELSSDDVLRARTEAVTQAGVGRKADHLLEVRGLSTHFFTPDGTVQAVDDVSFDVGYGETLGLVGESGCGKSVTALSIARLVPDPPGKIVAGSILFDGIDVLKLRPDDMRKLRGKEIGFIFQDPLTSLNPTLTIGYQIGEAISEHMGLSEKAARERVVELLSKVGIPRARDRLNDYPFQFSGGMRQRVMIAIALSCDPKLILADEPTTALDVTIQAQILELIQTLSAEFGTAVLMITHDLGIAAGMCDRVNVMYAGQIVETGTVDELFEKPRMPYSWGLLDSLPRIDDVRGDRLRTIEGMPPILISPPDACRFNPRCDYARDICLTKEPELTQRDTNSHLARCWATEPGRVDRMTATATSTAPRASATADKANIVEVDDLKVHFPIRAGIFQRTSGTVKAVDGVDFEVRRGETLGLVGESGCGKSTIGRAMIRLREPTSGTVQFDGIDLAGLSRRTTADDAPSHADHLPGPVRVARSADDGRRHHQRADRDASPGRRRREARRIADLLRLVGLDPRTSTAIRTSSRAASASASASPGRWPSSPSSSCATSRSPRSTCRSRRRCSTC